MEYPLLPKQMPATIKSVWRKTTILLALIFIIIGLAVTALLAYLDVFTNPWIIALSIYFGITILTTLIAIALIPYRYHFYRFEVTPEDLAFQKGYFFRSITYVPMNRIQHVETEQGPFLRKENLMEIVIHTAATSHRIAGLDMSEALNLREQIIALVKVAKEDV
ncbi:PH domain-containing protein [Jeotgalibaca sp. A122]|uniref:PH domain-containing protein n=1 Tax=Jeotgalibaca sp. A122 TaxID=3457322 RepID=UPI003FD39008